MDRKRQVVVFGFMVAASFGAGVLADRLATGEADEEAAVTQQEHNGQARCPRAPRPASSLDDLLSPAALDVPEEVSAQELFQRALATSNFEEQMDLLELAAQRVEPRDTAAALGWADQLEVERARTFFTSDLLERMALEDPEQALEMAEQLLSPGSRRLARMTILREWLDRDLTAASVWVEALPAGIEQSTAMRSVIAALAESEPERAFALVRRLGPAAGEMAMISIFDRWAAIDPVAAATAVATLPAGMVRMTAIGALSREWGHSDPRRALEWAQSLGTSEARRAVESILSEQARQDPATAFQIAVALDDVEDFVIRMIAVEWIRADHQSALAAFRLLPDQAMRNALLRSAAYELAFDHPNEAAEMADELEPGPERASIMARVAREMASDDIDAAASWALGLSGQEQQAAVSNVVSQWVDVAPEAAARFVTNLPEGPTRSESIREIVTAWSRHDPAQAAEWIQSYGIQEPEAVGEIIWSWATHDRDAAGRWVERLPGGGGRDRALSVLSDVVSSEDPAAAWAWAARIENPEDRLMRLEQVGSEWLRVDREGAARQIEAAGLPPTDRKSVV